MERLLIIDDDALVRMFLRQILPWEDCGYQIVGDARDGEEGLRMFEEMKPDMIIADVSMPVMNGIEFLKSIKEEDYAGGIIMLSSHEDFEYVKTAMALGADEYILKNHLNAEHLKEVLSCVKSNVDKRKQDKNQQREIEIYAKKGIAEIKKEVLQELLESKDIKRDKEEKLFEKAKLVGHFRSCGVILARLPINHLVKKETYYELCGQIATNNDIEYIIFKERVSAFIIDLTHEPSTEKQKERIRDIQKTIYNYTWEYLGINVSTGSSETCSDTGAVTRALRQAQQALCLNFYSQGTWSYEESLIMAPDVGKIALEFKSELSYLIESGDESKLKERSADVVNEFTELKVSPPVICDWIKRLDASVGIIKQDNVYEKVETIQQLIDYMNGYVLKLFEVNESRIPGNVSTSVKDVIKYIHEHFNETCSLSEAASHVSLTPSYLSALFKKEMGVGFVEYLTDVRLNQTKLMMKRDSLETIRSIAEKAGFADYRHFCKVFKKKTGYAPAAYRKEKQTIS
ncbi:MAG: response regulator [Suipraeoptans sp.]